MGEDGSNFRIRLYKNSVLITPSLLNSALTEADYSGYSAYSSNLWTAPAIDENGDAYTLSPAIVFAPTSSIVQNTVYGAYLTVDDGVNPTRLLQVEAFTSPILMEGTTSQIPLRWKYAMRHIAA